MDNSFLTTQTAIPELVSKAAKVLLDGGVILTPTDTVFGLACLPTFPHAVQQIFDLKQRSKSFNLPVMVGHKDQLPSLGVNINTAAKSLIHSGFFPGPLTIVFGFDQDVKQPKWLANREEVAVRIPDSAFLQALMNSIGPILMTSANQHKSSAIHYTVEPVLEELNGTPDLVITGSRQTFKASTIVNTRPAIPIIERVGEVSEESLSQASGIIFEQKND